MRWWRKNPNRRAAAGGICVFLILAGITGFTARERYFHAGYRRSQLALAAATEAQGQLEAVLRDINAASSTLSMIAARFGTGADFDSISAHVLRNRRNISAIGILKQDQLTHLFRGNAEVPLDTNGLVSALLQQRPPASPKFRADLVPLGGSTGLPELLASTAPLPLPDTSGTLLVLFLRTEVLAQKIEGSHKHLIQLSLMDTLTGKERLLLPVPEPFDTGKAGFLTIRPETQYHAFRIYVMPLRHGTLIPWWLIITGLAASLLAGGVSWYLLLQPVRLNRLVAEKVSELGVAEGKFEAISRQLQAFFENVEGAAYFIDTDRRYVLFNHHFAAGHKRVTGKDPEPGAPAYGEYPEAMRESREAAMAKVLQGEKQVIESVYQYEGQRRYYRTSFSPAMSEGQVVGISVYSTDLTSIREATNEVQTSNAMLQERVKEINCLYHVSELAKNDALPVDELLQALVEIIPGGWQRSELACAEISLGDRSYRSANFHAAELQQEAVIHSNGAQIGEVKVYYTQPVHTPEAQACEADERNLLHSIAGIIGSSLERKIAVQKLRESEDLFRTLTEETPVGVYILQDGKFIYVNPGLESLTGYTREQLMHASFEQLIHKEDVGIIWDGYRACLSGERLGNQYVFKGIRRGGEVVNVQLVISRITYHGEAAILGTAIDVTEKVEEEKRFNLAVTTAQEAERLNIGMELHDSVKQMMATSLLSLHMTRSCLDDKAVAAQHLEAARVQIREAVTELRNISHQLAPSIDDSVPFQEKVTALIQSMNVQKRVKVNIDFRWGEPISSKVQLAFYRIIQEQFNNILKHAQAGEVVIRIAREENWLELLVADDGVGFQPAINKSGIGIVNIKRRVKVLEGKVRLTSAPGEGCRLSVRVPLAQRPAEA